MNGTINMKTSRMARFAFAALVGIGSLVGSAWYSPVAAGSLDWLGNDNYVRCLKYMSALSKNHPPGQQEAAYDRGRRHCNKMYYPNTPGAQH
jgi:hypothetical protein